MGQASGRGSSSSCPQKAQMQNKVVIAPRHLDKRHSVYQLGAGLHLLVSIIAWRWFGHIAGCSKTDGWHLLHGAACVTSPWRMKTPPRYTSSKHPQNWWANSLIYLLDKKTSIHHYNASDAGSLIGCLSVMPSVITVYKHGSRSSAFSANENEYYTSR